MAHRHLITDPTTAQEFILAGKAIFTLANTATGNHATYRVEKEQGDGTYTVSLFVGTDNTNRTSYKVFGRIHEDTFTYTLRTPREVVVDLLQASQKKGDSWLEGFCKNLLKRDRELTPRQAACLERNRRKYGVSPSDDLTTSDPKVRGFAWVKAWVGAGKNFPEGVEFWTEGRCCTCGRRLTNPESIEDLEGPVCKRRRGRALTGTVLPLLLDAA